METSPMLCGCYRFHGTLLDDAVLPESKGSIFRNTFGLALRHVVCAMKQKDCAGCILDRRCLYPLLFLSPPPANHHLLPPFPKGKIRSTTIPSPFVIEPPETTGTSFRREDPFDFGLILFGRSNEHILHFIQTFEEMGRLGIGRRMEKGRSRFVVASVMAGDEIIWQGRERSLREGDFAEDLRAGLLADKEKASSSPVSAITLHLVSPLVGVAGPNREEALPFPVLMQSILGRILTLNRTYGKGQLVLDAPGLISRAAAVRVTESSLRRRGEARADRRSDSSAHSGKIVGEVAYEGPLGEFLPYIRFCERTHLGRETSWGSGKIRVHSVQP
ncbi:MAG: hypothetical protein CVU61_14875 [Deltaproteobacteria bacterium HGW-Deltaproteobacteria-19]|jgi:hypothetical protein|nr:MAG: hypothetical protein CVU61_14875 [Deltaproteobacteria bacterium HGW-Deltaproteobacteria-19]